MFDSGWARGDCDFVIVALNDDSLDPVGVRRWLFLGDLHMESEDRVDGFEGIKSRCGGACWFDRPVVVDIVDNGDACDGSGNG